MGLPATNKSAVQQEPPPQRSRPTSITRRTTLLSFSGLAALPLPDAIGNEAKLWAQEADFYRRRASEAVNGLLPAAPASAPPGPRLDAEFASAALACLRPATDAAVTAFEARCDELRQRELPYFQQAGSCGHCGQRTGPGALADRDFFNFEAYIRSKALLQVKRPVNDYPDLPPDMAWAAATRLAVGERLMRHILQDVEVSAAEAGAISPLGVPMYAGLLSTSAELDSIRRGVKALMQYLRDTGFVGSSALLFFGASKAEERNHMVWARGEPAFLKYLLTSAADQRACAAVEAEEGACISFVAAVVAAYLQRCGVQVTGLQRFPVLTDPTLVAEQWTLRRVRALPEGGTLWERGFASWKPDACPGGSSNCY